MTPIPARAPGLDPEVERDVRRRVEALRERVVASARRAGRDPATIHLVGVSKRQPADRVAAAVLAGVHEIGENYVQEARDKRSEVEALLGDAPRPCWRMIGSLQRNKARTAVALFDAVDTVDRESLARELSKRRRALGDEPLAALIQVNLSGEPQKGGVAPDDVAPLLAACATLEGLRVEGLMTVPAASDDPELTRPTFAALRALRERLRAAPGGAHLRELSMGMSADFEIAIEEGATRVRVGTALFGPRDGPPPEDATPA